MFKHTFDVVRDYASYLLLAIGAIAISVRFLTFGNGEIACMVLGKILLKTYKQILMMKRKIDFC